MEPSWGRMARAGEKRPIRIIASPKSCGEVPKSSRQLFADLPMNKNSGGKLCTTKVGDPTSDKKWRLGGCQNEPTRLLFDNAMVATKLFGNGGVARVGYGLGHLNGLMQCHTNVVREVLAHALGPR